MPVTLVVLAVVLLLFDSFLIVAPMWRFVFGSCFDIQYLVSFLRVLPSSHRGRESCLHCYYCLLTVVWMYALCVSSSPRCGFVLKVNYGISWSNSFSFFKIFVMNISYII